MDYGYDFIASKAESFTFTFKNSYKITKLKLLIYSVTNGFCSSSLRFKQGGSTLFTLYKDFTTSGWYTLELPYEISGDIEIILTPLTRGRTINVALTSADNYQPGNMIEESSVFKKWYVDHYETIPIGGPVFKMIEDSTPFSTNTETETEIGVLGEYYDYLSTDDNGKDYLKNPKNTNNSTITEHDADFNSKVLVAPGATVTIGIWASTNIAINYVPIVQTFNIYQEWGIYRAEEEGTNSYSIYRDYWEGMMQTEKLAEIEYPSLITYDLAAGSLGYFYPTDLRSFLLNLFYDKHPEEQILDVTAEEIVEGLQLCGKEWNQEGEDQLKSLIHSLDILLSRLQISEGNLYAKYEQYQGHNLIVLWCEVLSGSSSYHKPYAYLTDGWEIGLNHIGELFILREIDFISSRVDSSLTINNQMMVGKLTERYFWDWLTAEWLLANPGNDNQPDNNLLVNGNFNVAGSGWDGISGWQDEYNSEGGSCETVNGVLTFINNEYAQTTNDYSYIRQIIPINWTVTDEINLKGKLRLDSNGIYYPTNIGMAHFYLRFVDVSDNTLGEIMFYQRNDGYTYPNTDISTSFKAPTNIDDWFTFDYNLTSYYPVNLQDNWQEVTDIKATCILYTSSDENYKAEFDDLSLTVDRITVDNNIFGLENEEVTHSLNPITNLEAHLGVDPDDTVNPYLLQVTAKDNNSMPVQGTGMQLEIRNDEGLLLEIIELPANGSIGWHIDTFYPEISVKLKGNSFYDDSSEIAVVSNYSPAILLKTMGVSITEDASEEAIKRNIKLLLIQRYVTESSAFLKMPFDEIYDTEIYVITEDEMIEWGRNAGAQRMGLEIIDPIVITGEELKGSILTNDTLITVTKYWRSSTWPHPEQSSCIELTKIALLEMWLNTKLYRFYEGSHQLDTNDRSQLDDAIDGLYQMLQSDPVEFQSLTEWEKNDIQEEWSKLNTQMTMLMTPGFHSIEEDNLFLISWVIDVAVWTATQFANIINAIVDIVASIIEGVLDFLGFLWNEIVGPILGSVLEAVCSIIAIMIETAINLFTALITPDSNSSTSNSYSDLIADNCDINSVKIFALSLEQQSVELDSSITGGMTSATGMIGPVTDILSLLDIKTWIPPELAMFEPLFALFSPKAMIELIMDIIGGILLDLLDKQFVTPIFTDVINSNDLVQLENFITSFDSNFVEDLFSDVSLSENLGLENQSKYVKGINLDYKSVLNFLVETIEYLSELLNPILLIAELILDILGEITNFIGLLFELILGVFFPGLQDNELLDMVNILMIGNFIQVCLSILSDKFGAKSSTSPMINKVIEITLDTVNILFSSSLVNIGNNFNSELKNRGEIQLANNFSYLVSNAGCYSLILIGEILEDIAKCTLAVKTEGTIADPDPFEVIDGDIAANNWIANEKELNSELFTISAISVTLTKTITQFLTDLNNDNFNLFRLTETIYMGSLGLNIACSTYGAYDNWKSLHPGPNSRPGQYTGFDAPIWFRDDGNVKILNNKQKLDIILSGGMLFLTFIQVPLLY